jgi:intracellular septation protein A
MKGGFNMNNGRILKSVFNKEFLVSAVIPVILFSAFDHFKLTLTGTIIAGGWSLGVVLAGFLRKRKINVYAIIAAICSAIGLAGTIVSKSPKFYLASPIISDLLLAAMFLGSILIRKPLIQAFAEYQMKDDFPNGLRSSKKYKDVWTILTAAWGILSLSQAFLRIILLYSVSMNLYYSIGTIYGNVSTALFLVFSFEFPGWYWKKNGLIKTE